MAKDNFRWEPEMVEKMTTDEIESKMKTLVPGFDLGEFVAKTERYVSCEDLAGEEYYSHDTISDVDEDFIWMACEVLWQRLVPDKLAVEHVADIIEDNIELIAEADEKGEVRRIVKLSTETFEIIYRHIVEESPAGYRLNHEFYEQLQESTLHDIDAFMVAHLMLLQLRAEDEKVTELGGILGQVFDDDVFLEFKAQGLFAIHRREEGEDCYLEIISRNPDDIWFPVHAGDSFLLHGKKDFEKAKDYYALALDTAKKLPDSPEAKEGLYFVYEKVINLARETGEPDRADRMQGILDSLRKLSSEAAPPTMGKVGRNDPCPCGSGKKYKKCCGREATTVPEPPPFDQRLMERNLLAIKQTVEEKNFDSVEEMNRYWNEMNKTGKVPQWTPRVPVEQAQSLIYEALESVGTKRLKLAEQALKISPDCADAYVLLAEEKAQNMEEAASLYEAGVKAGERALGKKTFKKQAGRFWGIIETRPYMRARAGLAQCLWLMGRQEDAIGHYRELLRLNPNDNQGVRYLLAAALLEMGKIDALEELLGQYDEPTAAWLYTKPLVAYVKQGDTTEARKLLREALDYNPHVVSYLLGEKKLPKELPQRVGFGDKNEAVAYAAEFGTGWHKTKGAIDWLASVSGKARGTWQPGKKSTGVPDVFLRAFESEDRKERRKRQPGNEQEE